MSSNMRAGAFKSKLKKIPNSAGIYIFKDTKNKPLYVGKASDLKNRVKYYFKTKDIRLQKMVATAKKIDHIQTESDIEALILESQYIKKYQPPFNIMMRDDKQYAFVGFTNSTNSTSPLAVSPRLNGSLQTSSEQAEKYPRIFLTHQPFQGLSAKRLTLSNEQTDFIGPFTDLGALKTTLRYLRRIFPYCTCKQLHHNYCLNYHIGKCPGFCCLKIKDNRLTTTDHRLYARNIKAIKDILSGKKNSLLKNLEKEMVALGKKKEFKKAIDLKNKIEKIKRVFENSRILQNFPHYDISKSHSKTAPRDLKTALGFKKTPVRIEGYDIANIQGKYSVGAMVVFTLQHDSGQVSWKPDKNEYRKFKILQTAKKSKLYLSYDRNINTVLKPAQPTQHAYRGDAGMLKEILIRRLSHPEWSFPDLIIVDGGKQQLNAAVVALKHSGFTVYDLRIIALTKNEKHKGEKIFIPRKKEPVFFDQLPVSVRNILLKINSEAHRFAINYYRNLHRKNIKTP